MPSLKDAVGQDLSAYTAAEKSSPQAAIPPAQELQPTLNTVIRCPLPPIFTAAPDNLRQFYQGGQVPQFRIFSPNPPNNNGGGATGGSTVVSGGSSSGGGGGGGGSTPSQPTAQSTSVTSPALNPNQTFTTTFQVSKSFLLLGISTNSPARVQLYGTAQAQVRDAYRGLDVAPPAGTVQGIICDVALDTAPYQWAFQDRVGANSDSPQTNIIYVTLTNIDITTDTITLTLNYVPLES